MSWCMTRCSRCCDTTSDDYRWSAAKILGRWWVTSIVARCSQRGRARPKKKAFEKVAGCTAGENRGRPNAPSDFEALESSATTAAESASGKSTAAKTGSARAPGAARSRRHHRAHVRRQQIEIVDEEKRLIHASRAVRTRIPLRRLQRDSSKSLHPLLFHTPRHRIGQVFFKQLRARGQAVQLIFLHAAEKLFEAQHFFQRAHAAGGPAGHQPAERADHHCGKNSGQNPGEDRRSAHAGKRRGSEARRA